MGSGATVLDIAGVHGMLGQSTPRMVTVPGCKCPVVRVLTRGLKCRQCNKRWLAKNFWKLLLNWFERVACELPDCLAELPHVL